MSQNFETEIGLLSLPLDVIFDILSYLDLKSLGRLSSVCKRLNAIVKNDYIWIERSKNAVVTNQISQEIKKRSYIQLSAKEKCRISQNWKFGRFDEEFLLSHRTPYMPWLQLSNRRLWYSKASTILCYARIRDGNITKWPIHTLKGHIEDVCRFVCRDGLIVSGGRDGAICGWDEENGQFLFYLRRCHNSDINSVDIWNNVIVSGSRDKNVKIWVRQNGSTSCQHMLQIRDRVWSVAIPSCGRSLLTGSAGYNNIPPLQLYDIEIGSRICTFGNDHRNGAGVLHVYPESSFEFLSCGYDTCVRMWDTRCGTQCIIQWEDPHDSAVYCVASDHHMTVLSGTSRHGLVRLWDKRMNKSIQMYYVGRRNSPVYSLTFDPNYAYVALDRSLNVLSFSGQQYTNQTFRYEYWDGITLDN